jgi:rod shape-determining protein MreD
MIREIIKYIISGMLFLFCIFWQAGIPEFMSLGPLPILIMVLVYNFFEKPDKVLGILIAFTGGFLIDVYLSPHPLGIYALILSLSAAIVKLLVDKYVRVF